MGTLTGDPTSRTSSRCSRSRRFGRCHPERVPHLLWLTKTDAIKGYAFRGVTVLWPRFGGRWNLEPFPPSQTTTQVTQIDDTHRIVDDYSLLQQVLAEIFSCLMYIVLLGLLV